MQVVLVRSKPLFLSLHFFLDRNSVTERKKIVFSTIFLFKCSDWRFKAKLTEQQVVAYLVKSEKPAPRRSRRAEPTFAIFLTWKTEAHAATDYSPLDGKTLRKSLLFSDF